MPELSSVGLKNANFDHSDVGTDPHAELSNLE
jgi:hypothetical protein